MSNRLSVVAVFFALSVVLGGSVGAQMSKAAVNQEIQNAAKMNVKAAEAAVKSPKVGVRFLALKKLCNSKYDEKKLIPLLMQALRAPFVPMRRLAVTELAKKKHQAAVPAIYGMVINNAENWQLRLAAEAALEQMVSGFPEELKAALLKAQKPKGHGPDPEKPKKLEEAVKLYQKYAKLFAASKPKPK